MSEITKSGHIIAIENNRIKVEITSCSACSSCSLRSSCNMSENKKREVVINDVDTSKHNIGDKVEVVLTMRQGLQAIWYAFGIPLFIMLLTVISVFCFGWGEIISGISGIIVLIPYYFGLFLSQRKLDKKFYCQLKNNNSGD